MAIYVRDANGILQALDIPAYKGEKGEAGITPNLQVGDVVTLESGQQATIVRRGDDENPIFDFAIPKGDDGKDGIFVGRVDDAPDHAQVVVNDDASPYDLFFENANVSYMGDTYTSLKEKSDADIEYLLREIQTQHYEGQRITATNTYQKQVRSAILKGQTLVNEALIDYMNTSNYASISGDTLTLDLSRQYSLVELTKDNPFLVPNEVYTCILYDIVGDITNVNFSIQNGSSTKLYLKDVGYKFKFTMGVGNDLTNRLCYVENSVATSGTVSFKMVLLKGDYTNVDIPFFTGMQSVKLPVLKAIGQNLFSFDNVDTNVALVTKKNSSSIQLNGSGRFESFNMNLKLEPNTTYTFGYTFYKEVGEIVRGERTCQIEGATVTNVRIFYDPSENNTSKKTTFITTSTGEVTIRLYGTNEAQTYKTNFNDVYVNKGNIDGFEPYKSNILLTPQDLELRGIGEVRDELDLLTGEVAQHIGEYVLDENITGYLDTNYSVNGYSAFRITSINNIPGSLSNVVCDKVKYYPNINLDWTKQEEFCTSNGSLLFIKLLSTKASTFEELKLFLTSSPITIQYELSEKSIKTVDLNNQKVYSYDGTTHYTTSSGVEGHPAPILSIDVPTNLPALVSRQRDTIKDLEKENEALKEEVAVVDQQRESGDLELLSSDFDLDFRLMEIEFALDIPIAATFKEVRNMARTPYEMAKILILGGKYERSDMEYKLGRYLERKQITQAQYDELIALMEANELVV